MATILKSQIERADEINGALFDAIAKAEAARGLDAAYSRLHRQFVDSPLYWLYRGGNHIAVHSLHHEHRLAIIAQVSA